MKFSKTIIASLMAGTMIMSSAMITAFAEPATSEDSRITYEFTGRDKDSAGYAQGKISIEFKEEEKDGCFYLYWADAKGAIPTYYPIAMLSDANSSVTLVQQTAIPADATQILAFYSADLNEPSDLSASNASLSYEIPKSKQFPYSKEYMKYSFASFSDIHLSDNASGYNKIVDGYYYDEDHLLASLQTAKDRNVNFIVTNGDNISNSNGNYYKKEWPRFQELLAQSEYANPIYEGIGNHEIWVSTKTEARLNAVKTAFNTATGLDSTVETLKNNKPYYTFDEPISGDHFIMIGLEGGFETHKLNEFTDDQMSWLKDLLEKYKGDGKTTYIYEHADIKNWGAGDDMEDMFYDIPLNLDYDSHKTLQGLLYQYTDVLFFTGHTHLQFADQFNYVDVVGGELTAKMMHNSSVGGIRKGNFSVTPHMKKDDRTNKLDESEGYIMENYGDLIIANGTNTYYNKTNPQTTYIVKATNTPVDPDKPVKEYAPGDVDRNGNVEIKDAQLVQKSVTAMAVLDNKQKELADIDNDGKVTIKDSTFIQKSLAGVIEGKKKITSVGSGDTIERNLQLAKEFLESPDYIIYSSYNQYMDVKKEYLYIRDNKDIIDSGELACHINLMNTYMDNLKVFITQLSE